MSKDFECGCPPDGCIGDVGTDGYAPCTRPDWTRQCDNCDETPVVPITGLCGPCTFGESETIGGNW